MYLYVWGNPNHEIDPSGLGQAMCHPRKGSPPYSHCYLLFERPCDGHMGWGFYQKPEKEHSSGSGRGEGEIRSEENVPAPGDKPMGDLVDAAQGDVDDQALCDCIRASRRCQHRYELRDYNCVQWANEMLDCAAEG
ncbi:MAG: hypothetical protein HUU35_03665 [Armatimonadetes bacterium]|nr:hypothetical protein [Armatimonadota bacterium]